MRWWTKAEPEPDGDPDVTGGLTASSRRVSDESGCWWDIEDEGLVWFPHDIDAGSGYCVNCGSEGTP